MKKRVSEAHPEPSQTSKMEFFVKIVNGLNPLTIFGKSSMLDVRLCSECASEFRCKRSLSWWGTDIPNTHEKWTKKKALLNGTDVINEKECTIMYSACVTTQLKL